MSKVRRDPVDLRRRAEERLARAGPGQQSADEADARRLVHELRVHEVELELQNEELRSSRVELEAALDRYTHLFDFAPVAYLLVGSDGAIRTVNFAAAHLLRMERGRLKGRRLHTFLAQEDRARLSGFLARALTATIEGEPAATCELKLEAGEGDARDVRVTASELAVPGTPSATTLLLALEDVTARRRAEAALRDESRHKDEFLATLSHELRNPLGPIRNGLYLLEHAPADSDRAHRALAVIGRQLGHLTRIVEDLLEVTRIARGKVQLAREPLDLGELVRRTLEDHRLGFETRGVTLGALQDGEECWVDGDPTRLVQILGNLLGNAEKFTGRGGQVQVSLRRDRGMATLSVSDTGVGLEPEVRAHLFEPFSQGRQPLDRGRGGLGLGLAMVKGLVDLHGGTVSVSSAGPGSGTTFTVQLPVVPAPRRARAGERPHPAVRHRILVIEDNEDAASSLKQVLELSGHDVEVAADGPTGLALAHEHHPEIIICDIGLPGMDGYQLARAVRADAATRDVYLVALTGYARPEDAHRAAEAGFDRHVGKPPPLEKLEALLADIPAHAAAPPASQPVASRGAAPPDARPG